MIIPERDQLRLERFS